MLKTGLVPSGRNIEERKKTVVKLTYTEIVVKRSVLRAQKPYFIVLLLTVVSFTTNFYMHRLNCQDTSWHIF